MRLLTKERPLLGVFEVSVKRIQIKFWTTSRFIIKQLDCRDSNQQMHLNVMKDEPAGSLG